MSGNKLSALGTYMNEYGIKISKPRFPLKLTNDCHLIHILILYL
jgi:hypothetical protein